jgi:hypothetical protein
MTCNVEMRKNGSACKMDFIFDDEPKNIAVLRNRNGRVTEDGPDNNASINNNDANA